jgi:DNA-binding IclR family transcriptional regulator
LKGAYHLFFLLLKKVSNFCILILGEARTVNAYTVPAEGAEPKEQPVLRGRPKSRTAKEAGSQTLLAGLRFFAAVARMRDPQTLTEITARTGMSPSRAYRYLKSLTESEFLTQDPRSGRYQLGPSAIELSIITAAQLDAPRLTSGLMRDLTNATGFVSVLAAWGTGGPTVLRSEQGELETAIQIRLGVTVSLLTAAVGRIFLAYGDETNPEYQAVLARDVVEWNRAAGKGGKMTAKTLAAIRHDVRKAGLACVAGLRNPSIATVAVPVFGVGASLSMCLALMGVIGSFDIAPDGKPAIALRATAERLSGILNLDASVNQMR